MKEHKDKERTERTKETVRVRGDQVKEERERKEKEKESEERRAAMYLTEKSERGRDD